MASLITKENAIRRQEHDRLRVKHMLVACSAPMMTSSNGNIFRVTGPLWGESTGHRWIPLTKASDAELWCFLWSALEQIVEQTIETPVIRYAIALIMTSLGLPNHYLYQTEVSIIEPSGTDFWIKMYTFSLNNLHLKMPCTKCQLHFCRKAKVIAQINHEEVFLYTHSRVTKR